jgi:O-antigen/teichoic acid export membrane protein
MSSIKKQVVAGVKWTSLSTIILALSAILKVSILTRFLDKGDFGLMAIVAFIMGIMELFNDMGLTSAILHKQNISKEVYSSLYWLNLISGFFIYALLFSLAPLISDFYHLVELKAIIPLVGLNLIIAGVGRMYKTIESKHLLFKTTSIIEVLSAVFSLAFSVFLAAKGFGVYSLVYSALAQAIISNILLLTLGLKKYGLMFHFRFFETRPFLKIGIYQVGGQITNYFNRDLDIVLVGKFFSPSVLGGYSLAKQLVFRPAQLINPVLIKVASPTLAKFQGNIHELKGQYLRLVNIVSSINIPVYMGILLFAPYIIDILYGPGFEDIVAIVRVLSIYMIFRAIGNPIGSLVIATGRTDLDFKWNLVTLLIMPGFIYVGSQFGILEVTLMITLAMAILFVPAWRLLVYPLINATLKEYFKACFFLDFSLFKKFKF